MPVLGEEMARMPVQAGSSSDIPLAKGAHLKIMDCYLKNSQLDARCYLKLL